ncbi:MAG: hypothetical protein GQ562_05110 [Anaerolineales bacterium]|nr:hypothetical protein [Anaerolineales bacterium]
MAKKILIIEDELALQETLSYNLEREGYQVTAEPSMIDQANLLIWAAHNLERMADRVTNICERTIYVATGEMKELDVTDDEQDFLVE